MRVTDSMNGERNVTEEGTRSVSCWARVVDVMRTHFHKPDVQGARAVYAAVAAHRLNGQPVWPMAVAPPGSLKTEVLDALLDLQDVHFIDSVTPNTFISGQIREGNHRGRASSLLERVGNSAILVYADFSTVLSMPKERMASILADMRRIYDGRLRKEFGTSEGVREWEGRITFVVAATPDVDRHYSIFQSLGERFVMIRWHRPDGEAAILAMKQNVQRAKADMREAVHALFDALHSEDVRTCDEDQRRLAALAEFAVRARTHVARDRWKGIIYVPEPEGPTRLAQQLCQLAKGSALLVGRTKVEVEDMDLVVRVAFDCIPTNRTMVLTDCINTERGEQPGTLSMAGSTLSYAREDLASVGLLEDKALSTLARDLLVQVGILEPLHQTSPPNEGEEEGDRQGVGVTSSEAKKEVLSLCSSRVTGSKNDPSESGGDTTARRAQNEMAGANLDHFSSSRRRVEDEDHD